MLQKKHTRCKAAQPPHDSLIYPNDTSATLSQSVLRRQQKVVLSHVSGSIWAGDPLITVGNGYQGVRGRAFPTGFFSVNPVPYLFILINQMEPVRREEIKTPVFVMKKPLFLLGAFSVNSWGTKKTTETRVGAIFVLHVSRRDCLAAQNMVKAKKCVF